MRELPSFVFPSPESNRLSLEQARAEDEQRSNRIAASAQTATDALLGLQDPSGYWCGRLTADAVTTPGAGVDTAVRRIEYKYDSQGNNYLITSYDAASAGNIVNQVQRTFNGLGQLTAEYQSHSAAMSRTRAGRS